MLEDRRSPRQDKNFYKEIGWILLIKLCLLVALRLLFFSSPGIRPDGLAVSSHLLGASTLISLPASELRSSHDQ